MQTVAAAFTAEEKDEVRKIVGSTLVSWKKNIASGVRIFTIGTSAIGSSDYINSSGGVSSDWNKYQYHDESSRLLDLSYERALNQPMGGMSKALAEVNLDNTSGRYTPRYMGGTGEMFTALLPRRPMIINAGFNYDGVDNMIPQFVGVTNKAPETSQRERKTKLQATDFVDFISTQYVDNTAMFTAQRSDQIIETILTGLGFATSQYNLDQGINLIPFLEMKVGDKFGDIINKITQAEYGNFYQDEFGVVRFENKDHWNSSPYTQVQKLITTSMVLESKMPSTDHIINVVEVKAKPRAKQPSQLVFTLSSAIQIPASSTLEYFVNFDDPMLAVDSPIYVANTQSDGSGTDVTSSVGITILGLFSRSRKYKFSNSAAYPVFITAMTIYGRPAKVYQDIYNRSQRDSSVTAYEERLYSIDNDYVGSDLWANTLAEMLLTDYSQPENLQEITIRAIPELQLGDLISWQGRYWRVFGLKTKVSPSAGFVQDLKLLQRSTTQYFRIAISAIGGTDAISP